MSDADPEVPQWLTIAFTGHRTLAAPRQVSESLEQAISKLSLIHPRLAGISSAASGSDTLFAEIMAERRFPFGLILPFPCERFHKDFSDPADWTRVEKLIELAINVEVLHALTADPGMDQCVTPVDPKGRADQQKMDDAASYMDAGYRTIDRADVVLAVWDGKPGKGFGGTADAVAYARAIERPLMIIHPDTGHVLEERLDELRESFKDQDSAATSEPITDPRAEVKAYFDQVNSEAKEHGPRSRFLVRVCLQLFLSVSAIESAGMIFHVGGVLSWLFTIMTTVILIVAAVLMRRFGRSHSRWLQCRVEAEVCRSFLATWDIRRHATLSHQPRPAIPGLRKLFSDLRLLRQMDRSPKIEMDDAISKYHLERVKGQITYFERELMKAKSSLTRRRMILNACGRGALICSIVILGFKFFHRGPETLQECLHFLASTLPLMATAMGLTLITQEAVRRAARYDEMLQELRRLQTRLLAVRTWDAVVRVVTEIEEELLQELVEWRSFIRFTRDVAHPG